MVRQALIVEDEVATGYLLAQHLRSYGFEPTVLQEGKPAVAWVGEHQPALILLDLMLPDMDGYDICKELKLDRKTNLIPIVMVTARDHPQDRDHGIEVGANHYLIKPFSEAQLRAAIGKVMDWRDTLEHHGTEGEVHFRLKSDTRYLEELNRLLASLFHFSGLTETHVRQLTTAVRELGSNAIEWGHQRQVECIVTITYRIDPGKVTIIIRDTGPGFDRRNLPHAASSEDPISHMEVREQLGLREGGLGILMAQGLVDELRYNNKGNEVRLVKHFTPQHATAQPVRTK